MTAHEVAETEVWKDIEGYVGVYQVSSFGRVRTLDKAFYAKPTARYPNGRHLVRKGKLLKLSKRPAGYLFVGLYNADGQRFVSVHKLVMDAFIGPLPDSMERCHNDGEPRNNRLSNLRYDTSKGNHADRKTHGRLPFGSKISWAKLDEESVVFIRSACERGEKQKDLAKQFGVHPSIISAAVTRRNWAHVL